jgi:hypothetical protein
MGGYAFGLRPRLLRWGATDEEVRRPFPGAGLIPGGKRSATMAVTIHAPPARVWPWLGQMGVDRAGCGDVALRSLLNGARFVHDRLELAGWQV